MEQRSIANPCPTPISGAIGRLSIYSKSFWSLTIKPLDSKSNPGQEESLRRTDRVLGGAKGEGPAGRRNVRGRTPRVQGGIV